MNTAAAHDSTTVVEDPGLTSSLRRIRSLLERRLGGPGTKSAADVAERSEPATALQRVCEAFRLSPFERDILVLCAGMELDPATPALCGAVHGDERRPWPSFQIAMESLPEPHWTAFLPQSPLRYWKLIEVSPGDTLTRSALRISEPVLHFLMGVATFDERFGNMLKPLSPPTVLPHSFLAHAEHLVALWKKDSPRRLVVQLHGNAVKGKLSTAAAACSALGLRLLAMHASAVPTTHAEREPFVRTWERDAVLNRSVLLVDGESASPAEWEATSLLADCVDAFLIVTGTGPLGVTRTDVQPLHIDRPGREEQRALWEHTLGEHAPKLNGGLDRVVAQFVLDPEEIRAAGERALATSDAPNDGLLPRIWEACREGSRPSLEGRAQRVRPQARWHDIVLPESSLEVLKSIAAHLRQQGKVLEQWGFAAQTSRGLGVTALFCGPSGTGKTLAAEVLANELGLDLYQIDLSQIVNKYVGETEKNLRAVFDAAENSSAVLLFDEADALFGKRSEVKDSHDRYANIEVSYLLQRMEAYRGLAILTTNLRTALDSSFLRRIRFVVTFPFPDSPLRRRIWQQTFPPQTPVAELDWEKLSRLNLPGGNIRNIALNAAFIAADEGTPVRMSHLLAAARCECNKLEKPISAAETGGWV